MRGAVLCLGRARLPAVARGRAPLDGAGAHASALALAGKVRACLAARRVHPRIAVVATSGGQAERAGLEEFDATSLCDALDEMTDTLFRSVRSVV